MSMAAAQAARSGRGDGAQAGGAAGGGGGGAALLLPFSLSFEQGHSAMTVLTLRGDRHVDLHLANSLFHLSCVVIHPSRALVFDRLPAQCKHTQRRPPQCVGGRQPVSKESSVTRARYGLPDEVLKLEPLRVTPPQPPSSP